MQTVLGGILVVTGVFLGLYVGIWWGFIGGIVDIINEFKSVETDAMNIAMGVAKIVFSNIFGWLAAAPLFLLGHALVLNDK